MDKKALKQFIDDFYQAWKERDATKIPTFYDKNLKAYSDFTEITLEDILNRLEFSERKFAEVNYGIQEVFIDEDQGKVAVRMKQRHIPRDGSDVVKWDAIMLYTIVNHKITELWMSFYPNADYLNNA
ncbi:nuclear transport factor 2 family protein [Legionella jamestowniensis]|uniref:SnoaL-like domain-containing protein n=1 Tax=Legionella jamestowniensis TaxID=455 RepID=A0A0W0UH80_9GAMM|nr:nuclear transport factor 2 family protein [Legionella jamestowniensis]KTD07259.1 hypothetical protein Ljam_1454 [Legionella jamestowniensis]OCH97992.1 hypothetical protein A8135_01860 [Legionella jamestowniensis]SFL95538.1 SnoaL-like domain-containing protein [Legionella jamestowniensis DSM 19215]